MNSGRIHNFSAGPAVLPLAVLERVRENLLDFESTGIGIMEMSHRSAPFEAIINGTEELLRELLNISADYAVCFTTGGASTQFAMLPMNLLQPGAEANYIISGFWSEKAIEEAKKFGTTHACSSSKTTNFDSIPQNHQFSPRPAYLHFTSNNTIVGTQFTTEPIAPTGVPLVCDASSDFLHKKLDINKYGLIYAGAQKNLGPAGVTVVIVRKNLVANAPKTLPVMLNYNTYIANKSLYNTPPVLPIYVVYEVLKWIKTQGGLAAIEKNNRAKAALLYHEIDQGNFYQGYAKTESRSLMNVTFKLRNESLEKEFLTAAEAAGLSGLKGHKTFGGMRASIYNACPLASVQALAEFMRSFATAHG
ncbi:3-phosphoserine/phosphohydroxythreonine transaminase [bacterium]|nr:3-phosphoserine/phosphohydroxythreonine transaminase [bacterium]